MLESAMLCALTVVMAILGFSVPFCFFLVYILPVPTAIAIYRHDLRWGALCVIGASFLTSLLLGALSGLSVLSIIVLLSPALGIGFRRLSPVKNLVVSMVAAVASIGIAIAASAIIMHVNVFADFSSIFQNAIKTSAEFYKSMGMSNDSVAEQTKQMQQIIDFISISLPASVLLSALFLALINFLITHRLLRRLDNPSLAGLPPFSQWRLPIWFALLYGFSLIGLYWGSAHAMKLLYNISINVSYFSSMFCRIQGLSLLYFFLVHYNIRRSMKIALIVFVLFTPVMQIVMYFGLFDMFFDYRRRFIDFKNRQS